MSTSSASIPQDLPDRFVPPAAPLGPRLGAAVIDATIVATLAIVTSFAVHLIIIFLPERAASSESIVLFTVGTLIAGAYFVYAWGYEGATLGQRMLGLRVIRVGSAGAPERIGMRRAFLRLAGLVLGLVVFDLLVAFLRSDRRALHDLIAESVVVPQERREEIREEKVPLRPIRKGGRYA